MLTVGEPYPPLRQDSCLSQIGQSEMHRINLGFSSGLAAWWADCAYDRPRVNRRVRAALQTLPMPWRNRRPDWYDDFISQCATDRVADLAAISNSNIGASLAKDEFDEAIQQREANWVVNQSYRNGPIKD